MNEKQPSLGQRFSPVSPAISPVEPQFSPIPPVDNSIVGNPNNLPGPMQIYGNSGNAGLAATNTWFGNTLNAASAAVEPIDRYGLGGPLANFFSERIAQPVSDKLNEWGNFYNDPARQADVFPQTEVASTPPENWGEAINPDYWVPKAVGTGVEMAAGMATGRPWAAAADGVIQGIGASYGQDRDAVSAYLKGVLNYRLEKYGAEGILKHTGKSSIADAIKAIFHELLTEGSQEFGTEPLVDLIRSGKPMPTIEEMNKIAMQEGIGIAASTSAITAANADSNTPMISQGAKDVVGNAMQSVNDFMQPQEMGITPDGTRMPIPQGDGVGDQTTTEQRAFHGTGNEWEGDKPDSSKIGTGEGNQSYSHGLYWAENKATGEEYRRKLSEGGFQKEDGTKFEPLDSLSNRNVRAVLENTDGDIDAAIDRARGVLESSPDTEGAATALEDIVVLEKLKSDGGISRPKGNLYEVDINDKSVETFVDLDASLREQKPLLKKVLDNFGISPMEAVKASKEHDALSEEYNNGGVSSKEWEASSKDPAVVLGQLIERINKPVGTWGYDAGAKTTGMSLVDALARSTGSQESATKLLNSLGIKGARYLDAGSRNSEGDRTSNFVTYDDDIVTPLKKNGKFLNTGKPSDPEIGPKQIVDRPDQVKDQVRSTGSENPNYQYQVGKMGPKAPTEQAAIDKFNDSGADPSKIIYEPDAALDAKEDVTYDTKAKAPAEADPALMKDMDGALLPNGMLQLTHYGRDSYDAIDPLYAGTGADATANARGREKYNMAWTGVNTRKNPYVMEHDLTGDTPNNILVNPAKIYNTKNNKALGNLWDERDVNGSIKRMQDAGYLGMRMEYKHGNAVGLFEKTKTSPPILYGPPKPPHLATKMGPEKPPYALQPRQRPDKEHEDIVEHDIGAEKGTRKKINPKKMDKEESAIIDAAFQKHPNIKISKKELTDKIQAFRAKHPASDGWVQLKLKGVDKKGNPIYEPVPLAFNIDPKTGRDTESTRPKRIKSMSRQVVKDYREIEARAKNGDEAAKTILLQADWYKSVRKSLKREFGSASDTLADILGGLSPRAKVKGNWKDGMTAVQNFARGKYDVQLKKLAEHLDSGKGLTSFPDKYVIRKPNGAKYNMNSKFAMLAMLDRWNDIKPGTSPKARNFSGNLAGRTLQGTIDMWAGRYLRRKNGGKRIPPKVEPAVTGDWNADASAVTGEFGFAQAVLKDAAKAIGVDPDALQAMVWYLEKEHWTEGGWTTSEEAEGGSFQQELARNPQTGYEAGVSPQQDVEPTDQEMEAARADLLSVFQNDDSVTNFKAQNTVGDYGGPERSFDFEWTATADFNPTPIVEKLAEFGTEHNQSDIFISRKLDGKEALSHPNARPGMEIRFADNMNDKKMAKIREKVDNADIPGFTFMQDPRGKKDIGIRFQWVPEIAMRFDDATRKRYEKNPEEAYKDAHKVAEKMGDLMANLDQYPDLVKESVVQSYDTHVIGQEDYGTSKKPKSKESATSFLTGSGSESGKKPVISLSSSISRRAKSLGSGGK